jgi:hypothetical protein
MFEQLDSRSEHDVIVWEVVTEEDLLLLVRTNGNAGFGPVNIWDGERWHAAKYRKHAVCRQFLMCENTAVTALPHPILGDVPACQRCADKLETIRTGGQRNGQ